MSLSFITEELKHDVVDISESKVQESLKEVVKIIDSEGFDALSRELIEGLFRHDIIDVSDNIGVSCVLDGSDAFILARVPEFDNRFCLICTECYLNRNIHLGHTSGKLLIGMDSKYYKLIQEMKAL